MSISSSPGTTADPAGNPRGGAFPFLLVPLLAAAGVLYGCALPGGAGDARSVFGEEPRSVELTDVPYHPQEALQCGPAALAEVLQYTGVDTSPAELRGGLFIPAREGTLQLEMLAQSRRHDRVPYPLTGHAEELIRELHAGNPVLVFQNLGLRIRPVWHYAVLIGYDADAENLILRSGADKRRQRSLGFFLRTWDRADRWAVVVTAPDRLPATAKPQPWLQAAVALEETGREAAAETAYRTGAGHWPQEAGFHLGLINLHYRAGALDAAEAAARHGIRNAGSDRGVLFNNLAIILADQARWDEAERAAAAAVREGGGFIEEFKATRARVACRDEPGCPIARPSADD